VSRTVRANRRGSR